ncbi:MAG: hypothetical protein IJ493_10335 [Clostridia bacterium]|nr:hypothetical protein [Clostridia bacterium]
MRQEIQRKINMYTAINEIAIKGEIVVFGSTFAAGFPFYELSQDYVLRNAIYNRSIEGLTLKEAATVLQPCVIDLKPKKVFLAFGDNETDESEALESYRSLLHTLQAKLPHTALTILAVKGSDSFNCRLEELAHELKLTFLRFDAPADQSGSCYKHIFKELSCFFHDRSITFTEAFSLASE